MKEQRDPISGIMTISVREMVALDRLLTTKMGSSGWI
jgi:hypothetical protein